MGRCHHGVAPFGSHGTTLFVARGYVWYGPKGEETNVPSSSAELVVL